MWQITAWYKFTTTHSFWATLQTFISRLRKAFQKQPYKVLSETNYWFYEFVSRLFRLFLLMIEMNRSLLAVNIVVPNLWFACQLTIEPVWNFSRNKPAWEAYSDFYLNEGQNKGPPLKHPVITVIHVTKGFIEGPQFPPHYAGIEDRPPITITI